MNMKQFTKYSIFFIKSSNTYIGKWDVKHILYFPKAYIKFMRASGKDIKEGYECI